MLKLQLVDENGGAVLPLLAESLQLAEDCVNTLNCYTIDCSFNRSFMLNAMRII